MMALEPEVKRGQAGSDKITEALKDAVTADEYTVAALPAASAANKGKLVSVTNGAAGQPCLAFSNGTNWLRITLGAAVAAS